MHPTKSITERVCQALGFEGLALLICTPLLVWITGRPALEMGAVTLGLSLLALTWNIIFNSLFDRLKVRLQLVDAGASCVDVRRRADYCRRAIDRDVAEYQPGPGVHARHRCTAVFPAVHLCVSLGL